MFDLNVVASEECDLEWVVKLILLTGWKECFIGSFDLVEDINTGLEIVGENF